MTTSVILEKGVPASAQGLTLLEMQSIVTAFDRQVAAAQMGQRPTKSLVRSAVRRQGVERCPTRLRRLSYDTVIKHANALTDLFLASPDDVVALFPYDIWIGYQRPGVQPRLNAVEVATQDVEWTDEWGTRWAHTTGGVGAHPVSYPIQDWSQLDNYLSQTLPDAREPGRLDAAMLQLEVVGESRYCIGQFHLPLWDRLQNLRGFENICVDFYTNRTDVCRLLEAISDYAVELVRCWAEAGVDAVFLADDWGTQSSLMISPDMWREFFKPHYARIFAEAHHLDLDVIMHSCGNVMDIVGDLIDIGLDALDPVQPGPMDQARVAKEFGGHVAFCGAVDTQSLLVSASPSEVKDSISRTIDLLGRQFGNSLIVGPGNMVTPDVPIENLQAMFEACHDL